MTNVHGSMTSLPIDLCIVTRVASELSRHVDFAYHKPIPVTIKLTPGLLQAWAKATMLTACDTINISYNDFRGCFTEMQHFQRITSYLNEDPVAERGA